MNGKTSHDEEESQVPPAEISCRSESSANIYRASLLQDILRKKREEKDLEQKTEERKQKLKSLKARVQKMQEEKKRLTEFHSDFKMLHKKEDADRAKRERRAELQREEEKEKRLEEEFVKLMEKKEELRHEVERHAVYNEYMEQVVKMTTFQDAQQLTSHLESLLQFQEHLYKKEAQSDQKVEEKKKELAELKEQHHLVQLQGTNQLTQLQTELTRALSETSIWEKRWNHIQETTAKKTLQLGEIKMATLNLFEMTGGNEDEEEAVDINDTERQLDQVKMFIRDHEELLRHYQTAPHRHKNEKRKETRTKDAQ
ncbi:coiled-coil domain-containing protein 42 [Xyrichtys novacula]|nr:coiled-coil domain-containing protein 42 [Xyrichtys novacula]